MPGLDQNSKQDSWCENEVVRGGYKWEMFKKYL